MANAWRREIGVDMGSSQTRIGSREQGILVCEPTVVAVGHEDGQPAALGGAALELIQYAPEKYHGITPVQNGVIRDQRLAIYFLRGLLQNLSGGRFGRLRAPTATFSVPCGLGEQDYGAWEYCAAMAGLRRVYFLEEPLAAALGEGRDVYRPYGRMAVSLGAGDVRAAVTTFCGIAAHGSRAAGGMHLDGLIAKYVADTYDIHINRLTAERIKLALGAQQASQAGMRIFGKTREQERTAEALLHPSELSGVLQMTYEEVLSLILQLFSEITPELLGDIAAEGILLYGGNALLYGLQHYLQQKTALRVHIADSPLQAAARGAYMAAYADAHPFA